MTRFPPDYPIIALRGHQRPTPSDVRHKVRKRIAYLQQQVAMRAAVGDENRICLEELATLGVLLDTYEEVRRG